MKNVLKRLADFWRWFLGRVDRTPVATFFTVFGICLILIIVGNIIRRPKSDTADRQQSPKEVAVFSMGESPRVQVSARIEKTGVVSIAAQTSGIVRSVHVTEGSNVAKGKLLVELASSYQGGTTQSVSRQIAQKNYDFVNSSFETQKQLVDARRELANLADAQADRMRELTLQSIADTRELHRLNDQIFHTIDDQLSQLEATNTGGENDALITELRQAKSGVLTGLNALSSGLRANEYQANEANAPAQIGDRTRELTNKQLDLELKSLELNREISRLNLTIARIGESLMYPVSPVAGVVERIHVRPGQMVNPGTIMVSVKGNTVKATAVALISPDLARRISRVEPAVLHLGNERVEELPRYVSTEPTDGALNSVTFAIPDAYEETVGNLSNIMVELPVSGPKSSTSVPFVPIDAVYQTQTGAYLFVVSSPAGDQLTAVNKAVTLGNSIGSFVEVVSGLDTRDQVIIDRTVSSGDPVSIR